MIFCFCTFKDICNKIHSMVMKQLPGPQSLAGSIMCPNQGLCYQIPCLSNAQNYFRIKKFFVILWFRDLRIYIGYSIHNQVKVKIRSL